jgi:hypothetical protein
MASYFNEYLRQTVYFRPFYARRWAREYPQYADLFETRKAACDVEVAE